jgi:hypothetical protein
MALGSTQPLVEMSTRNILGGKGGRCLRLTISPLSRAECHEIWEPKPPGTLSATLGMLRDSFIFNFTCELPQFSYLLRMCIVLCGSSACIKLCYSVPWNFAYTMVMKRRYKPWSGDWLNALFESPQFCVFRATQNCRDHRDGILFVVGLRENSLPWEKNT